MLFKNDGSFRIRIRDLDLAVSVLKAPIQVDMQVDNLYASVQLNIKKQCDDEDRKRSIFPNNKEAKGKNDSKKGH